MNHLDLFSGIGGFALAARWAGLETIAFCEKDKFCQKVLAKHWPHVIIYPDIKELDFTAKVDLLTAGFPCQPFSIAGSKKGVKDDRYLWPELIRIIGACRPTWLILENVPGIIPLLDPILKDLEDQAYSWQAFLIPASSVGAPHKRERLWIIANTHGERCNEEPANQEAKSIRSKRANIIREAWKATSNTDSISGYKAYSKSSSELSAWQAWQDDCREFRCNISRFYWEENQPPIPGVDDGLPNVVDRNRALGNAIVPQIALSFMLIIQEINYMVGAFYGKKA